MVKNGDPITQINLRLNKTVQQIF